MNKLQNVRPFVKKPRNGCFSLGKVERFCCMMWEWIHFSQPKNFLFHLLMHGSVRSQLLILEDLLLKLLDEFHKANCTESTSD